MNIYEKLLGIQRQLKAPKNQYNSFGKYNYRNCEDILEAVKPLCAQHKAVLTVSDEIETVGERYYVKATATLYDTESSDKISVTARAREEAEKKGMDGSQVTGASSSYARKYALNGLFAIDDTKDSDATNKGDKADKPPKATEESETEMDYETACGLKTKGGKNLDTLEDKELKILTTCGAKRYEAAAKVILEYRKAQLDAIRQMDDSQLPFN